ncbi:MAG: ABC transporter substrate-binding protein [Chloroflexota bacterium]|nr:ABC transporter substrate-binding protein [Chloroflexota bacterium]
MISLVRRGVLCLALLLLLAAAVACQEEEARPATPTPTPVGATQAQFPLTIGDDLGRQVTLPAAPQRIVSLSAGATEIFFAIGAGQQVIAVDRFSDFPAEARIRPQLDAFQPSVEAIAGLQPDLVLMFFDPGGVVDGLERVGSTVLFLDAPESVDGVLEQIRLLGRVTGHVPQAEALIQSMQARIDAVGKKLADVPQGPRIFHEVDATLYTAAPNSFVGDLYTILRAQNIAAGAAQAYPQLSQEVIIERDPEVIILADEAYGESPQTVKARAGWSSISAVKSDRIYSIDPNIVSRPGPRLVEALETLARLLYPEKFR